MQPLSVHPNCYKKNLRFFSSYNKEKMSSLSTKERKAMSNKPLNYSIPLSSWRDMESTDTFFSDLGNEYKLLGTKSNQIVNFFKNTIFKKCLSL